MLAASLVVGTGATVGYGLATGFERAADQAGLPDVIARFDPEPRETLDERVRALPNLAARSYRFERTNVGLWAKGHHNHRGAMHVVMGGRRGYLIVDGRDLSGRYGEVVIERGLAREWALAVGDRIDVGRPEARRVVVGISVSPDNVAYPLARAARVYVPERFAGADRPTSRCCGSTTRSKADVTLTQARSVSFGLGRLEFVTREGVRVLLSQAAGIVIALLVAFSLVALLAAGTMLAAERARRRPAPARRLRRPAGAGVLPRADRCAAGDRGGGRRAARGSARDRARHAGGGRPGGRPARGAQRAAARAARSLLPLLAALATVVTIVVAAATWPAWRAARRPPVEILRGGAIAPRAQRAAGGLALLGARFATAARARWVAAVATIGVCAGVVTLMLALASLLERLRDDPGTVGKRYQLTVQLNEASLADVRAVPGVADAGPRYATDAADSFRLDKPFRIVAYPGDHTRFEAPPLAAGRRLRGAGEIEVGLGLADALGLRPGSPLAAQLPDGEEVRFRVAGVVRALENDGRIVWARPDRLGDLSSSVAVRLEGGADRAAVARRLEAIGAPLDAGGRREHAQRAVPRRARRACCAASGWRSGWCACTRSCRRWR